jgi:hypothetical protein
MILARRTIMSLARNTMIMTTITLLARRDYIMTRESSAGANTL